MNPLQPPTPPPAAPETSGAVIAPAYQPPPQPGAVITRQGTYAEPGKPPKRTARGEGRDIGRPGKLVSAANRWRENYNALVGMTIARAVEHLNMLQRGDTAYPQWAFRLMERRFPTLSALLSCCEEPLATFDWHIKINATMPPGMTAEQHEAMAARQKATLEEAYNRIDNLRAAITHMHMANFRGYAHLQKHRDAEGNVFHLEPLDQWCVCRDGLWGNWFWNPDSKTTSAPLQFLGEPFAIGGSALPLEDFVIFERPRPIDEMALFLFIRANLCEKDWDAFLEVYGLPSGVVTLPNGIPPEKVSSYEAAASAIAEGGSGALPFGSSYSPNDSPRGTDPFTPRLRWLSEQVVLVGTGGKLTMLTESGSGTLAGGAQADTFTAITHGRCRAISEALQQQFDREILAAKHPGEPVLVYFDFGAEEEEDMTALVGTITSLAAAGYRTRAEQVAEKTGLQIEEQEPEPGKDPDGDGDDDTTPQGDTDGDEGEPDDDDDEGEDDITNREWSEEDHPRDEGGRFSEVAAAVSKHGLASMSRVSLGGDKSGWVQGSGAALPEHAAKLAVPPAWTQAHFNPDPNADLQAIGVDSKGRVQRRYSEAFTQKQAEAKFKRIASLQGQKERIFGQTQADLTHADEKTREAAHAVHLIQQMGLRPGSDKETGGKVKAYGASTLEGRHVVEREGQVRLQFVGKKGVSLDLPVADPKLAAMLKTRAAAAGADGRLFKTSDTALRDYTHGLGKFKVKDFRTLKGTDTAAALIAQMPAPTTEKEYKKSVMAVAKHVSGTLGNTPSIALKAYISPRVFHGWKAGVGIKNRYLFQTLPMPLPRTVDPDFDPDDDDLPTPPDVLSELGFDPDDVDEDGEPITNRSASTPSPAAAMSAQLAPLGKRLDAIAQIADPATRQEFLAKLLADFPAIKEAIGADESFAQTVEPQVVKDFLAGLARRN